MIQLQDIDLIAIGPLTNLAVAFSLDFDLPKKWFVRKIQHWGFISYATYHMAYIIYGPYIMEPPIHSPYN